MKNKQTTGKKLVLLCLMLGAYTHSFAMTCHSSPAKKWYNQAIGLPASEKKLQLLMQADAKCPQNVDILTQLGDTHLALTQAKKAVITYQKLFGIHKNSPLKLAYSSLRMMNAYHALHDRINVSKYANVIQKLKQNGMTWAPSYETFYQNIYQKNRASMTKQPPSHEAIRAALNPISLQERSVFKNLAVVGVSVSPVSYDMSIPFDFNSAKLTPQSEDILARMLVGLKENTDVINTLEIIGHTDTRGDDAYNQRLSVKRALAVRDYLSIKLPALSAKMNAIGKGESEPINHQNTLQAHAANRRVVFRIN